MDDVLIGQIGVFVFGLAIAAMFLVAIAKNPD